MKDMNNTYTYHELVRHFFITEINIIVYSITITDYMRVCHTCGKKRTYTRGGSEPNDDRDDWSIGSDHSDEESGYPTEVLDRIEQIVDSHTVEPGHIISVLNESTDFMGELSKELLEKQDENGEIRHIKVMVLQNNGLKDIHVVTKLLPLAHGLVFLSLADNDISSISGLTDVLPESLIILDLSENEISDIDSLIVPRNVEMVIVNKNRIPEGGTLHYIDQLKVFRENNPNANIHMYDMA
jgi:hypothetical protein